MILKMLKNPRRLRASALLLVIISVAALTGVLAKTAHGDSAFFLPGNLRGVSWTPGSAKH